MIQKILNKLRPKPADKAAEADDTKQAPKPADKQRRPQGNK